MLLLVRQGGDQYTLSEVVGIEVHETPRRTVITPQFAEGENVRLIDLTGATVELLPEPK